MARLESVFWDHPEFTSEEAVRAFLERNADGPDRVWMLARFLEHGRFVDTVLFFSLREIRDSLPLLRLSPDVRRKWNRFLEIYAKP